MATIKIKQVGSPIRRPASQRQILIGLGLNKMHKIVERQDTPRGARRNRQRSRIWCRWSTNHPVGPPLRRGHAIFSARQKRKRVQTHETEMTSATMPAPARAGCVWAVVSARARARPRRAARRARRPVRALRSRGFEGGQMPLHMRLPKRGFSTTPSARIFAESERGHDPEVHRRGQARRQGHHHRGSPARSGVWCAAARTACVCWARAEITAKASFAVTGATKGRDCRGRKRPAAASKWHRRRCPSTRRSRPAAKRTRAARAK